MKRRSWLGWWRRGGGDSEAEAAAGSTEASAEAESFPISSDHPIRNPGEDLFGVDPFAKMVARSIAAQGEAEGTVIAVNGPWGGGKSSVVNLVIHHLQAAPNAIEIVPFNPWWFSGSPALARAFFSTIASALKRSLKQKGKAALDSFLARLGDLNTYTEAVARAAEGGAGSGVAYFALGDRSLEDEHTKIAEALRSQEKSFLVVIDDIDRLSPDEVLLVLGLVKSVGRLPRVTYLLAFDRLLIERLLAERFPSEGGQYLEKILQASFDLPPTPPEILREMLLAEANKLFDVNEAAVVRFMNLFYDIVVPNLVSPRNAVRLAGSLRVTSPAVKREVDAADFMSTEALRLFWPAVYRNVRARPDLVCGSSDEWHGNAEQRKAEVDKALMSGVAEADQPYVKVALQRLFPRLEGVWSNMSYGRDWEAAWDLARLVCSPRHFATYFQYAANPDALPSSMRDDLVTRAGDEAFIRQTLLDGLAFKRRKGGTRAALLLEELTLLAERIPAADVEPLITALFRIADELDRPEDEAGGFSFGSNPLRLHWLLNRLVLPRYPLDERSKLLLAAARHATPGWCADLAERCLRPYQPRVGDERRERVEPLTDEATARAIGAIALEDLRAAAQDGRLLSAQGAHSMLWALYRLSPEGSTEVRALTDRFLEDDDQTIALARALTSVSWSQGMGFAGMGDRVARSRPRVHRSGLEKIVGAERLHARVTELLARTDLSDEVREVLERFLKGWDAGQKE